MIELSTYLTSNAYKALAVRAQEFGIGIIDMLPRLKICETDQSLCIYYDGKVIVQRIAHEYFDANMKPIDLKAANVSMLSKSLVMNKMRKRQKSTVLINFE